MVQEFEQAVRVRTGGKFERHMYYRRPKDAEEEPGWLVIAGTNAARIEDMTSRGFEPLFNYGTIEAWEKKTGQFVADLGPMGVWRPLLEAGGGKEFPATQVMTYRWYKESPLPGRNSMELFPQLQGHNVREFQCPACKHPAFLKQDGAGGLDHLATHLTISHNWTLDQILKYGEQSGLNFQSIYIHREKEYAFGEGNDVMGCEECDYKPPADSKNPKAAVRMHKMSAHKPFEVASAEA